MRACRLDYNIARAARAAAPRIGEAVFIAIAAALDDDEATFPAAELAADEA